MAKSYDETSEFWTGYQASIKRQKQRNSWSEERLFNLTQSPSFQQKYPRTYASDGVLESNLQYHERLMNIARGIRPRNLNKEELRATNFTINPTKGFFPVAESVLNPNYLHTYNEEGERSIGPRSFVSLDIETDDRQRPLSISALKFVYDTQTGKFHSVGSYQRFYETHQRDIRKTHDIHGLTPELLRKLRQQQGATYSTGYFTDPREEKALREFIGGSTIVGQNIVAFDLPTLFHGETPVNNVIDTVIAARNVWKGRPNGLEDIFKRVMGKTMDQAGLPHHDANADTLATMMVLEKMTKWKGPTGDAIRYVMTHPGVHLGQVDEMLEGVGQVVTGTYQNIYSGENIGEHYMSADKIRISAKEHFGLSQSDMDNLIDPLNLNEGELLQSANAEISGPGFIPSETIKELQGAYNAFGFWKKASLVREISKARSENEINALLESAGFNGEMGDSLKARAQRLRSVREQDDRTEFDFQKERRLERMKRHGQILFSDDEKLIKAASSFEELDDAIDKVTISTQKWTKSLHDIGNIKMYDPNQYWNATRKQWGSTMEAAQGVLPDFVLNPVSRLGDAFFNWKDRQLSTWNAVSRTWNSGIGTALTGIGTAIGAGVGGPVGAWIGAGAGGAVSGLFNAGTQVYGNIKQAQMERFSLGVQNTFNTLGAMISWISTPFRLLHRITKMLIGSFGGLTGAINSFMKGGISAMSDMGNPLTELTGVGYSTYEGTTMMDVASLFNKGSMNSVYEDFAKQQKAFYTLGQVNTNRLVASSLLGVYSDVYNPSVDAAGSYNTMVNKLLASMQGQTDEQKARTMYLASEIDSNLPPLLRTANLLGVTDVNQLMDPRNRGMYWRTLTEDESQEFRWTQYEYGAATEQFGYTKMRLSNTIWDKVGRELYNGINRILDSVAGGDIQSAVDTAVNLWEGFKIKIQDIWKRLKDAFEGNETSEGWGKSFKIIGLQAMNIALEVAKGIVTIWDAVMGQLLSKAQGLISYLSTIQFTPHWDGKKFSFDVETIQDSMKIDDKANIFKQRNRGQLGVVTTVREAEEGIAKLYNILFPNASDLMMAEATEETVRDKLRWYGTEEGQRWLTTHPLDLSSLGITDMRFTEEGITDALEFLKGRYSSGPGLRASASAWITPTGDNLHIDKQSIYAEAGLMDIYNALVGETEGILTTTINAIQDKNNKTILELRVTDSTGKVRAKTQLTAGESVITKNLIQLQQLVADGVNLVVQQVSGN